MDMTNYGREKRARQAQAMFGCFMKIILLFIILFSISACAKQNALTYTSDGERSWEHGKFKIIMDRHWSGKMTSEGNYTFEHDSAEVVARIHVSGPSKDPEGIKHRAQNPDTYSGRITYFEEKFINGRATYHVDVSMFETIAFYKKPIIWTPADNKSVHFWSKYMIYGDSESFIFITLVSPIEHHQETKFIMDEFLSGFRFLY